MKNFDSFEDFGYQKINESIPPNSDWASGAEAVNVILASEDVAAKLEMQSPSSITEDTKSGENIWNVSSSARPNFYLKVTLSQYPDLGTYGYNIRKVEKIIADKADTAGSLPAPR